MKALSIRAPWWWFILHGGKDIENRDWPTKYRGQVLVHASMWYRGEEVGENTAIGMDIMEDTGRDPKAVPFFTDKAYRGAIVGSVEIVDCVERSESPWFFGRYGFVLANPRPLSTPIPFKGALKFFDVPDAALKATAHYEGR
jgi:hypothetical protein